MRSVGKPKDTCNASMRNASAVVVVDIREELFAPSPAARSMSTPWILAVNGLKGVVRTAPFKGPKVRTSILRDE